VRFALRHDALGDWMDHSHIIEHASKGMMGDIDVQCASTRRDDCGR